MPRVEKQITINAPADRVFSYLADFPRHSEWAQHRLKLEPMSPGPVGQGTTFQSVGHQMGRDFEETVTVTEFAPNERIVFESQGREARFRHWIQLQPGDGGVQVTKGFEVVKAPFPMSLLAPVIMTLMVHINGDLMRIKAKVEGS